MKKTLILLVILSCLYSCNKVKETSHMLKLQKATALFQQEKFDEAKVIMKEALNSQSITDSVFLANLHALLALTYEKQDSLNLAEKHYLFAKQIDSSDYKAWFNLASLYNARREYSKAEKHYQGAIKRASSNYELLAASAVFYYNRREYSKALDLINRSYAIDSLDADVIRIRKTILKEFENE